MATTVDTMASRIGKKCFTSTSNKEIGPIRDTIRSSLAAKRIEQMQKFLRFEEKNYKKKFNGIKNLFQLAIKKDFYQTNVLHDVSKHIL